MSFWNISANAAASIVNGLPSGIDNDQGTIRGAGNVVSTDKFSADAVSLGYSRFITVPSGQSHVDSPLAAGAYNAGDQVIRRVTNDIAGVSNTTLLTGASNGANREFAINQKKKVSTYYYKTAVRTGGWHEFSGVFSPAVTVASSGAWSVGTTGDVASSIGTTDSAANPTASIPGEFAYRNGSPLPVQADYAAKTNF